MKSLLILVAVVIEFALSSRSTLTFLTRKSNGRIVGGYPHSILEVPWIVQLTYNRARRCAGSIVSSTKILSAAHCTKGSDRKLFMIRAGATKFGVGGQVRRLSKIIEHPGYDQVNNDISILFLEKPLQLSSDVAIINIDLNPSALPQGTEVTISGWGKTCETCQSSLTLLAVKVPTVDNKQCRKIYKGYQINILPSMLCCGLKTGGKDSCQGDSGGPVTLGETLVGIVSFGIGCARPNIPGIYTKVSYYAAWIKYYL